MASAFMFSVILYFASPRPLQRRGRCNAVLNYFIQKKLSVNNATIPMTIMKM